MAYCHLASLPISGLVSGGLSMISVILPCVPAGMGSPQGCPPCGMNQKRNYLASCAFFGFFNVFKGSGL